MVHTRPAPTLLRFHDEEPQGLHGVATPLIRLVARVVDCMAVIALVLLVAYLTGTMGEPSPETPVDIGWLAIVGAATGGEAVLLRWWGRTPGKAAFGLRVTAADGGRLSWGRAAVRALVVWAPLLALTGPVVARWQLVVCLGLLAVMGATALFRPDHRGLQDLLVGSFVRRPVRTRPARLELAGIDLAVLGVAGFLSAYGAYGFTTPTPTWYFDSPPVVPFGTMTHIALAPEGARTYIFTAPLAGAAGPECSIQSGGGSVVPVAGVTPPRFEDSYVPGFAEPVRDMRAVYRISGTIEPEDTAICTSPTGTAGSYAVGAVTVPTRQLGNVLEGVSAGLGVCGLALVLLGRRTARG